MLSHGRKAHWEVAENKIEEQSSNSWGLSIVERLIEIDRDWFWKLTVSFDVILMYSQLAVKASFSTNKSLRYIPSLMPLLTVALLIYRWGKQQQLLLLYKNLQSLYRRTSTRGDLCDVRTDKIMQICLRLWSCRGRGLNDLPMYWISSSLRSSLFMYRIFLKRTNHFQ